MTRPGRGLAATVFLLPAVVAIFALRLWPAAIAVVQSLVAPHATGFSLDNYTYLLSDPTFRGSMITTALYSVLVNPLQIGLALALAVLLNTRLPTSGFWRTAILLPVAIPQSVSAVVWGIAMRPDGVINGLFSAIGLPQQPLLSSPQQALACLLVIVSWIGVGFWMTFLIAGLQEIPITLYEAARVDGANAWQQFRFITLPQLRRQLGFVLVADTVGNFLVFAPVQILTRGGPQHSTNLVMFEIYTRAFRTGDVSSAQAATVILTAIVLFVVIIQFRLMGPVHRE
jgi:multiple sugar transport system permease protein